MHLQVQVDPRYQGLTIYFFRKSGMTGKVQPLGTAVIDDQGFGFRSFDSPSGGILAVYGHLLGAEGIANNGYSNTVAFKVK